MGLFGEAKSDALKEAEEMLEMDSEHPEDMEEEGEGLHIPSFSMPDLSFLKAKTGSGDVEEYLKHPLNFKHSAGAAQMIRGFTGLFGDLDLAVLDITLGAFELAKEKRNAAVTG